jgi:hypothetical protein
MKKPINRQNKTIIGGGIFENCKTRNVPAITPILRTLKALNEITETSFMR